MNVKKVISTLVIAIFITSSLYAGPCINCVAPLVKNNPANQVKRMPWANKSLTDIEHNENTFSQDEIDDMIALDDNDYDESETISEEPQESEIVLTYDSRQVGFAKTLYACEDIVNNIVACDDENKEECECV